MYRPEPLAGMNELAYTGWFIARFTDSNHVMLQGMNGLVMAGACPLCGALIADPELHAGGHYQEYVNGRP